MDAAGVGGAVTTGGLDDGDAAFFSRRGHRCCGCFWAPPWASSSPSPSPRERRAAEPGGAGDDEWWHRVGASSSGRRRWWRRGVDALMKVREWSELVAGPRWKTFIRRFRRGGPSHGAGSGKLNYDPLSYSLNFDEGHAGGSPEDGDYASYPDFSARFVAPLPASAKTSMDLGGRDAPPLFLHHHHHQQAHSPRTPPAAARG
ncbi:unnamed protein product [Urochloa humidicola]